MGMVTWRLPDERKKLLQERRLRAGCKTLSEFLDAACFNTPLEAPQAVVVDAAELAKLYWQLVKLNEQFTSIKTAHLANSNNINQMAKRVNSTSRPKVEPLLAAVAAYEDDKADVMQGVEALQHIQRTLMAIFEQQGRGGPHAH